MQQAHTYNDNENKIKIYLKHIIVREGGRGEGGFLFLFLFLFLFFSFFLSFSLLSSPFSSFFLCFLNFCGNFSKILVCNQYIYSMYTLISCRLIMGQPIYVLDACPVLCYRMVKKVWPI